MDNHPIPQDVTHFQFKLIGELTIKQFAYVGAGVILAWIAISLPIFFLIKLLLALLIGGAGAVFAFVPIEGRPADLMLSYFFKALFKPNQFIFHKDNSISLANMHYAMEIAPTSPQAIPNTMPSVNNTIPSLAMRQQPLTHPQPYIPQVQNATRSIMQVTLPQIPLKNEPVPQSKPQSEPVPKAMETIASIPQPVAQQVHPIDEQLQSVLAQKEQLEKQLALLQQQLAQKPQPTLPQTQELPKIVVPPSPTAPKTQTPMVSDFPNIIIGVVKDSRGNVLANILVEVKDTEDNPVRAFKTNALGQFASATSLLNGTYMMLFEDPAKKHKFDPVQITASGEIMQPIEVTSVDDREELRKELFG